MIYPHRTGTAPQFYVPADFDTSGQLLAFTSERRSCLFVLFDEREFVSSCWAIALQGCRTIQVADSEDFVLPVCGIPVAW